MARSASVSVTTTPGPQSRFIIGKVNSPGCGVTIASQRPPASRVLRWIWPLARDLAVSSKPSGSQGRARNSGAVASSASAIPEVKPPPPQHTSTSAVCDAGGFGLRGQFQPDRALTRDHLRFVVGSDQGQSALP